MRVKRWYNFYNPDSVERALDDLPDAVSRLYPRATAAFVSGKLAYYARVLAALAESGGDPAPLLRTGTEGRVAVPLEASVQYMTLTRTLRTLEKVGLLKRRRPEPEEVDFLAFLTHLNRKLARRVPEGSSVEVEYKGLKYVFTPIPYDHLPLTGHMVVYTCATPKTVNEVAETLCLTPRTVRRVARVLSGYGAVTYKSGELLATRARYLESCHVIRARMDSLHAKLGVRILALTYCFGLAALAPDEVAALLADHEKIPSYVSFRCSPLTLRNLEMLRRYAEVVGHAGVAARAGTLLRILRGLAETIGFPYAIRIYLKDVRRVGEAMLDVGPRALAYDPWARSILEKLGDPHEILAAAQRRLEPEEAATEERFARVQA